MNRNNIIYACVIVFLNCQLRLYDCTSREYLEDFIKDLQEQVNEQDETECVKTTLNLLKSVQNHTLWATWAWDSMNKSPVGYLSGTQYQLGEYDQCLKPPWVENYPQLRTQYCLVHIQPIGPHSAALETGRSVSAYAAVDSFTHIRKPHAHRQSDIYWGLCLPSSCDTDFIKTFATVLLKRSYLGNDFSETATTVELCHDAGDSKPVSWIGYCLMITIAAFATLAVVSTYVHDKNSNSKVMVIARAFSMKENMKKLTKSHPEELRELNGIRALATVSIVSSHHLVLPFIFGPVKRTLDFEKFLNGPVSSLIPIYVLTVDEFYVISGFLMIKHLMSSPLAKQWQYCKTLVIGRFIRFVPLLALATCTYVVMLEGKSGPASTAADMMLDHCKKNWWLNLLMLSNYIASDEMCNIVTWTAQTDFQMSVVAIALVYLCSNRRNAGIIAFSIVALLSLLLPAITTYTYNIRSFGDLTPTSYHEFISEVHSQHIYIKTHNRIAPYIVGMALAYMMYKPNSAKKTLSKKVSIFGAILSLVMVLSVSLLSGYFFRERRSLMEEVTFSALHRPVFGAGFALFLYCLLNGTIPLVNNFLRWNVFRPLSRISYEIYLIHFLLLVKRFTNSRVHIAVDQGQDFMDSFGTIVASILLAFIAWLLVGAPVNNLCSIWFKPKSPLKTKELDNKAA